MENYHIKYRISEWTKEEKPNQEKIDFLNELKSLKDYVKDVKLQKNEKFNIPEVVIETSSGVIKAMQFSTLAPKVRKFFPNILNDKRMGNCYDFAYKIAFNLGPKNQIVAGYIYGYSDKSYYLHSWIETTLNGEEYVIDGTLNAIINKSGYYLMQHAKPITKISDQMLENDIDNYIEKIRVIPLEVYLVFRNEIISELEKNQGIFR